jgi:hypothetical protein
MSSALPAELQQIANEFRDMKDEAAEFLSKINESEFNKRPANNGWSIAECIDHLIVTGVDYCDQFEEALKILAEKNTRLTGELKHGFFGGRFMASVEPPVKRKFKSPTKWKPDSNINKTKATAAYLQLQDRWVDLIQKSAGWDITKVKLPSPAVGWVKFSAYDTLGINAAHQRRHIWQAENVKKSLKK